jgi:hypothetical protein
VTRGRLILAGVLVSSLGLNAYLWVTAPKEQKRPSLASRDSKAKPKRVPVGMPDLRLPPPTVAVPSSYAVEDRTKLEERLVEVEGRIDELLRPNERYALLDRTPETEDRVRPYLDRVFSTFGRDKPNYSVECHGRVCKVSSSEDYDTWIGDLQRLPGREMFRGMSFGRDGTFIELSDEPIDGKAVIMRVLLAASEDVEACGVADVSGTLSLSFALDAVSHTIRVSIGGSLEREPIAQCVRVALEKAIARGYLPPDVTSVPAEPIGLTFPLEPRHH